MFAHAHDSGAGVRRRVTLETLARSIHHETIHNMGITLTTTMCPMMIRSLSDEPTES